MSSTTIEEESELRRGPWTLEEDTLLTHYIARHGEGRWNMLAKCAGLKRTGKSCRLRWLNYLKPDIKRGNLSPQEQLLILELHSMWGNRWSKIAQHLPGRTDNEIKNYWRTRVQKQARQLNIESNSKRFLDAVRCFWMPRLLQKVHQTSSSSSSSASYLKEMNSRSSDPSQFAPLFSPLPNKITHNSNHGLEIPSSVTSQSLYSTDLINISDQTEITPHLTSSNEYGHNYVYNNNNQVLNESYNIINTNGYERSAFECQMTAVDYYERYPSECQMGEVDWICNEITDNLWNMDDIWQFREWGEMGS